MLITAAQFKEHYPQTQGTGEDALFGSFIDRADALMANYLGWPRPSTGAVRTLASTTYTNYYNRPTQVPTVLCLGVAPVTSVTSVHVDVDRGYGAGTLITEGTDFDLDPPSGQLGILPSGSLTRWPVAWQATKVVFVGGFVTTPADLVTICAAAVRHLWDLRNVQETPSLTVFGDATTRSDLDMLLPASVRAALDAGYRCP